MSSLPRCSVPLYRNPLLQPGLDALSLWLAANNYSLRAIDRILAHAAVYGTSSGTPYLDAEDEAGATDAFIDALEPLLGDSAAWDDPGVFLDAESILAAVQSRKHLDRSIPADAVLVPPELEDFCLPRVSGGAPAPTAQDIDDATTYPDHRGADRHSADAIEAVALALYGTNPYR